VNNDLDSLTQAWDHYHNHGIHKLIKRFNINNETYYIVHNVWGSIHLDARNKLLATYRDNVLHLATSYETETDKRMISAFKFYCANWSIKNVKTYDG